MRQTYVRPAGPPCLWPDRPPALELTKLLNGGKGCSRRKHGYRKESGSRALLAFLAGRGAAAENMDTEKNLEAALFSLFCSRRKHGYTKLNREGVQPQKTWIQKRIWKPRSSRFSGGKGCSRRKHGYRKESGSRALLAFLAGRGAAAENMDTEKNLEAALFSLFWREGVQPQKTWIQKRIWSRALLAFLAGRGAAAENMYRKESGSRALLAFLAGRGAAAENMDTEKNLELCIPLSRNRWKGCSRLEKPRSSRFSSPTSIVCQGLVQTGLALHPMSRNRWSLEISSLKMFRLQCGLFLTQDVSPAVWRWRLLNARCFACSFWMAPSCLPFEHCNINFSCHSNIALWSAIL